MTSECSSLQNQGSKRMAVAAWNLTTWCHCLSYFFSPSFLILHSGPKCRSHNSPQSTMLEFCDIFCLCMSWGLICVSLPWEQEHLINNWKKIKTKQQPCLNIFLVFQCPVTKISMIMPHPCCSHFLQQVSCHRESKQLMQVINFVQS